ncbi:MAG: hypothetical protein AAB355_00070 [Patescibacteria group bacterium]|mgnify:CR=1 FL=1
MGTPVFQPFSISEVSNAIITAKKAARMFRDRQSRAVALRHLCCLLLPMVPWLDKPLHEIVGSPVEKKYLPEHIRNDRGMLLVSGFAGFFFLVLRRDLSLLGCYPASDRGQADGICYIPLTRAGVLVDMIADKKYEIAGSIPWGIDFKNSLREFVEEDRDLSEAVEHFAFLKFLSLIVKTVGKTIAEREERLKTMRGNLSFAELFVDGLDPLQYVQPQPPLTEYSVFRDHGRGTVRNSGDYFVARHVKEIAEQLNEREKSTPILSPDDSRDEYRVNEFQANIRSLSDLFSRLRVALDDRGREGARDFSREEKTVIGAFAQKIGKFPV